MKTFKRFLKEDFVNVTPEMVEHSFNRTNKHIELVNKYLDKIAKLNLSEINNDKLFDNHDASKFEEPELKPYIIINWYYHCKANNLLFELENIDNITDNASFHHIKTNPHHPEYWDSSYNTMQANDKGLEHRDEIADKIVDASKMPYTNIAQMVADWTAMEEEINNSEHPSAKEWADKNINVRWKFTPDQINFIYKLIDLI